MAYASGTELSTFTKFPRPLLTHSARESKKALLQTFILGWSQEPKPVQLAVGFDVGIDLLCQPLKIGGFERSLGAYDQDPLRSKQLKVDEVCRTPLGQDP
jgi:hypothetical protein